MDELLTLKPKLTRLKLSGVSKTLETRISQALREKWSFSQFLEVLLSDEVERRDFKQLGRRLIRSGLEPDKTLEIFDFRFNPRIHEPTIRELVACQFVAEHETCSSSVPRAWEEPSGPSSRPRSLPQGHEVLSRRSSATATSGPPQSLPPTVISPSGPRSSAIPSWAQRQWTASCIEG